MFSFIYRLVTWALFLTIGGYTGYSIYEMQSTMRGAALKQVSRPWPKLPVAQQVDHSVNPYIFKRRMYKKMDVNHAASNAINLYAEIYAIFKKSKR